MLVKYKTILYGDKPFCKKNIIDGKPDFRPNKNAEYKIISHDFCCPEMENCIRGGHPLTFSDWVLPEARYFVFVPDGYGDGDNEEVKYCPFCGEKVEYKEVEKARYKKVESFDYIEEVVE